MTDKSVLYGYIGDYRYNLIKKIKRRKRKDRCICGHLHLSDICHSIWAYENGKDVFDHPCTCKKFISEKPEKTPNV